MHVDVCMCGELKGKDTQDPRRIFVRDSSRLSFRSIQDYYPFHPFTCSPTSLWIFSALEISTLVSGVFPQASVIVSSFLRKSSFWKIPAQSGLNQREKGFFHKGCWVARMSHKVQLNFFRSWDGLKGCCRKADTCPPSHSTSPCDRGILTLTLILFSRKPKLCFEPQN